MNLSFSISQGVKNELLNAEVDFGADTFKALLMRDAFSFNSANHQAYTNIKTNTGGAINLNLLTSSTTVATINRQSGSFITDGFVTGNWVTLSAGNNTGKQLRITSVVSATELRIEKISGADLVDDGTDAPTYISAQLSSDDEHETDGEYTQGGFTCGFAISGSLLYLTTFDMDTEFGTTNLLEAPGFVIYDDTPAAAADKVIIAFARFARWRLNV